jgi:acyl dehydratase
VRHVAPVFHGDTIYSRSTILEKADGMVTVASEGVNQRGEVVVKLERKIAVPTA